MDNQQWCVEPPPEGHFSSLNDSDKRHFIQNLIVEHVDAENARDMERTLATYSEQCVFDDVPTQVLFNGKQAIADSYQERFEAYPNLERIITRMTIAESSAVVEITMTGPQEKSYRGFAPRKGVSSKLSIVGHFEINDHGLITRETAYYDQLAAAIQLGALPDITTTRGKVWLMITYPLALLRILKAKWRNE